MRHKAPWTRSRRGVAAVGLVLAAVVAGAVTTGLLVAISGDSGSAREPSAATRRTEDSPVTRIGYVPYWDQERAFGTVQRHPGLFDQVSPVWYTPEETGRVRLSDVDATTVDREAVRALQERGVAVIPTVTSLRDGEWAPEIVQALLRDPDAVRRHVDELVDLAVTEGYDGIDIDYEDLDRVDRSGFTAFIGRLGTALHAEGKLLSVDVHPKTSDAGYDERNVAQDFRAIGEAADQVRIMTYDHSWDTSPPGPGAPARWVEDVVGWAVTQIPREKVVLGIVLLGYDWGNGPGVTVDHGQATGLATAYGASVQRSDDGTPWFTYQDRRGHRHEVWFEDAESARAKLAIVRKYGLGGVFFWRLGGEDPDIWASVRDLLP